jgi:pyruvate kinase
MKISEFLLEQQVDWIGLSFVRTADDIILLKEFIAQHCDPDCPSA